MKDLITYEVECEVCEVESQIVIELDEEIPAYCPMCGSPVEVN